MKGSDKGDESEGQTVREDSPAQEHARTRSAHTRSCSFFAGRSSGRGQRRCHQSRISSLHCPVSRWIRFQLASFDDVRPRCIIQINYLLLILSRHVHRHEDRYLVRVNEVRKKPNFARVGGGGLPFSREMRLCVCLV
jgi:hypothetical protein